MYGRYFLLFAIITVAGCGTNLAQQTENEVEGTIALIQAKNYKLAYDQGFKYLTRETGSTEQQNRVINAIKSSPSAKQGLIQYIEKAVSELTMEIYFFRTHEVLIELKDKSVISQSDFDSLEYSLDSIGAKKNRNNELKFLLTDDVSAFIELGSIDSKYLMLERSINLLKMNPHAELTKAVITYVEKRGVNSKEYLLLQSNLPDLRFSEKSLKEEVARLYPEEGKRMLEQRILTEEQKDYIKTAVNDRLKDPFSSKFKFGPREDKVSYCGQVIAKNSYGAYGGWKIFYVLLGDSGAIFMDLEGRADDVDTKVVIKLCADHGYHF